MTDNFSIVDNLQNSCCNLISDVVRIQKYKLHHKNEYSADQSCRLETWTCKNENWTCLL